MALVATRNGTEKHVASRTKSNDPPDGEFLELLTEVFLSARAEVVRFPNAILGEDSASTVYVARKASRVVDV